MVFKHLIFKLFIAFYSLEILNARLLEPLIPTENYTHSVIVDEDNPKQYQLFWKLLNEDEVQFEAHVNTTGWIGIGLSSNGGMAGSDIVIGWVKDGKTYLKDCHAKEKATPQIDSQQDYTLLYGAEINSYTIIKYKRKLNTCDQENDIQIKAEIKYLIFAWNNEDPLTGKEDWIYHGTTNRFNRAVLLLSYKDQTFDAQASLPKDTFTFNIKMNNVKVPPQQTYYFCDLVALPQFENPVHLIQFEILFQKDTKKHYHHLVVNECDDDYVPNEPLARECGAVPLPKDVTGNCFSKLLIAWGIGGQTNFSFPIKAGYRMNPVAKPRYLYVELHYDNPDLREDIVDSSGFKLYFTEELREHDLGLFVLGADGSPLSLQIPPKSNRFEFTSICYPECTEKYIPESGIYAFSAFLHQHYAGRSIKTTLVRNDISIRHLFENPVYNFDYQFLIDIEPFKLEKGDIFITKCVYETKDRTNFTYEGEDATDEMCFDYIYYYPRIPNFSYCFSFTTAQTVDEFYKSLINESLIPFIHLNETTFSNDDTQKEIMEFFNTKVNKTPKLTQRFEEFYSSDYFKGIFCGLQSEYIYNELPHYTPKENAIYEQDKCSNSFRIAFDIKILSIAIIFILILV